MRNAEEDGRVKDLARKIVECISKHAERQNVFLYGDRAGWAMDPSRICDVLVEAGACTAEEIDQWSA